MPHWAKRILRSKKSGDATNSDVTEGSDDKVPKFLDQIEISDPEKTKAGQRVRFVYDAKESSGLFYWLQGKILERVTKASRSKRLKYTENHFNVGELKSIFIFREQTKPLPESVWVNLTPNFGWTILTETNKGNILQSAICIKPIWCNSNSSIRLKSFQPSNNQRHHASITSKITITIHN